MAILRMMESRKKSVKNSCFLIISLFLLSACSHRIKVRTPSTRFISPEAQSDSLDGEFSVYYAAGSRAELDLKNGQPDNPLNVYNEPKSIIFDSVGLSGDIGIIKSLDLLILSNGKDTPTLIGIKYQLFGKTRKEAKKGDHSVAISYAGGNSSKSDKDGEDLELTAQDEDSKVELDLESTDLSLIYGYRFSNTQLVYTGMSYTTSKFSGILESQNVNLNNQKVKYNAFITGAHLGYFSYLSKNASFKAELSGQKIKWTNTKEKQFAYFSMGFGIHW